MLAALTKVDMQPGLARCPICGGSPYCEQVEPWPVKTHGPAPWAVGCYRNSPFEHFVGVNGDDHADAVKNWNIEAAKVAALSRKD